MPQQTPVDNTNYGRSLDPNALLDLAGVPTIVPPVLEPRHVEAIFGWSVTHRRQAESAGILEPMPRKPNQHARYLTLDVAKAIIHYGIHANWDAFDE